MRETSARGPERGLGEIGETERERERAEREQRGIRERPERDQREIRQGSERGQEARSERQGQSRERSERDSGETRVTPATNRVGIREGAERYEGGHAQCQRGIISEIRKKARILRRETEPSYRAGGGCRCSRTVYGVGPPPPLV